ncbi:MAG TPA: long-chain-acyl-CoA synthetase [Rhizomicrobium sp.]|nr:long-chain-acyl-CoA synthetase [Rhizomicrobium sp.]
MSLAAAIRREAIYLNHILRTLVLLARVKPDSRHTIVDIVEKQARATPDAPAVYCLDEVMSYRALDARANTYAHWAIAQGLKRGDCVALFMENKPDFLCCWLGLFKAGLCVALINTNQRGQALAHSIGIAGAKQVIVGLELASALGAAESFFTAPLSRWVQGGTCDGMAGLDQALAALPTTPVGDGPRKDVRARDRAFFIYTSGTTGLPKAANFSHVRMLFMMSGFVGALVPKASDRIYNPLPLYHATGGVCAVGLALMSGGALIVKRKFSVGEFWSDIHKYDATMFSYIGEICRWLLNAPPGPHERDHHIRAITGNGLRPEIWPRFQDRFAIPRIVEFYGATEGNVSMLNYDGTVGSVGRVPDYIEWRLPARVVRFDVELEMPVRGPDGLCIECGPQEVGEAVGRISKEAGRDFEGYTKASDTEKKILRNVFKKGDAWFRTGDLMRRDEHGYFFFVDRIGDTFRWKGENVATSEVAEALTIVPGIKEVNVYGVAVPGADGRAGMAALVVDSKFDVAGLAKRLEGHLSPFARPCFLRLQPEIEVTGTFKQRKVELVAEGFDPRKIADPLYWYDPTTRCYEKLTSGVYDDITNDRVKL